MSKQIAVRLPDDMVEFVDQLVSAGKAKSRAAVMTQALDRERRRQMTARDATILAQCGGDPDMDRLAEHAVRVPLDLE